MDRVESGNRTALIAPLDWGLGHASRCVPIVRMLRSRGWKVVLCADAGPLALLRSEFPDLEWKRLPSYKISYPKSSQGMFWSMLGQLPKLAWAMWKDRRSASRWVKETGASVVISDNRSGFFSKKCCSVYITHQLRVRAPRILTWGEPLIARIHQWIYSRFDEVWIPDLSSGLSLAGTLSRGWQPQKKRYIGLLSRFERHDRNENREGVLVILSGPEPQRSLLEEKVAIQLAEMATSSTIIRGLPDDASPPPLRSDRIKWVSYLSAAPLEEALCRAEVVICRSGYSSLMDLSVVGTPALLIPTPGQTEQEYLAERVVKEFGGFAVAQESLDLSLHLTTARQSPPLAGRFSPEHSSQLLAAAIDSLETRCGDRA